MSYSNNVYFEQIPVGSYKNFSYLVADKETKSAVIFDPAWEVESLNSRIVNSGFNLKYIVNTHAHFDHIEGNQKLKNRTGAKIVMHQSSLAIKDIGVSNGQELHVGNNLVLKFLHTPGHSPESICTIVNDFALITGDTLFIGECGRVDLPGGDAIALFDSFARIRGLDQKLVVYPGHDYGSVPFSSLRDQVMTNYTLSPRTRDEFVKFMNEP